MSWVALFYTTKKNNALMQAHNQKFFRAGLGVCESRTFSLLGHFHILFKTQSGPFFQKSGNFFLPSCAPVSVAEYASIFLNMPKYPWKWLNKLLWLCQGSEYASSSYMFGRLLKMPSVLNKPEFWIWHGCICKGYGEFWICLIMAPYPSITLEYASIYLNVPQYAWTWLNIPECLWMYEYPWICLNKQFWLCHGSKYAAI